MQPYVALGLGLQGAGHEVRLVAADFFKAFVEGRGLDFFPINTFGLLKVGGEAHTTIAATIDRAPRDWDRYNLNRTSRAS